MTGSLADRSAIVTGASEGLGLEVARAFVMAGASVLLCARDSLKLLSVAAELRGLCNAHQQVEVMRADVSRPEDVTRLVAAGLAAFSRIQILVNNAGVYGPKGAIDAVDWDEWVHAVEVNLMGSVLMIRAVLPHFRACRYGKIIQLSGGGATGPLPFITAYAASKAAIVRVVESLAQEAASDNVDANCIAPGALNTRLLDEVLAAGPHKVGQSFYERAVKQKGEGGTPPEKAAQLAVFLASAASDGITGRLISAVWDPWVHLPEHLEELRSSDIYTLRRIVPRDRGQNWADQ